MEPGRRSNAFNLAVETTARARLQQLIFAYPQLPTAISAFVKLVEPLGVYPEYLASLNLKADLPFSARPTNFGYITKTGKLWTDPLSWTAPRHLATAYNWPRRIMRRLPLMIGGVAITTGTGAIQVTTNGTSGPHVSALLPHHLEAWADAIRAVV
jgi:hypothetical protein